MGRDRIDELALPADPRDAKLFVCPEAWPQLEPHPRGERRLVEEPVVDAALVLEISACVSRDRDAEALLAAPHVQERSRLLPRPSPQILELARQLALQTLVVEIRFDGWVLLARIEERPRDVGAREGTRVNGKGGEKAAGDQRFQLLVERVVGREEFRRLSGRGPHPERRRAHGEQERGEENSSHFGTRNESAAHGGAS